MSDASQPRRKWQLYIRDMLDFANDCFSYTAGMDQQAFISSKIAYDATLRKLELIGEAASHVPNDIRDEHSGLPWRMIIATRNHLIHGYLGIDNDTIWSIIQDDLSNLISELEKIIDSS